MADSKARTVPRQLSEVEAHQLLARAAELDARLESRVSAEQLWSAAREAGISEAALAQAQRELDGGMLLSPARGAVMRAGLRTFCVAAVSAALVITLMASPKYPLAQLAGLVFAAYGAYDVLRRVGRRFGNRRDHRELAEVAAAETVASRADEAVRDDVSMAIRVFTSSVSPLGAA